MNYSGYAAILSRYDLEIPGVGVALFGIIVYLVLILWNSTFKSASGKKAVIIWMLFFGLICGAETIAILACRHFIPNFDNTKGIFVASFIRDTAYVSQLTCLLIYMARKTSKNGKAMGFVMIIGYLLCTFDIALYAVNMIFGLTGRGAILSMNSTGTYTQGDLLVMYISIAARMLPFIFTIRGWKRALPKERTISVIFALLPWAAELGRLYVYGGNEMNVTFVLYTVLAMLMVFFDQIHLDANIKEQSVTIDKMTYEAQHDKLTGLAVASAFEEQVGKYLSENGSQGCCLAVIDIDNFKELNSIYGRQFGDDVLKSAAESLNDVIRYDDIPGRVGGDEFAVFFKCEVRYFDGIVSKIRDKLTFELDGVPISASIGAVRVSDSDSDYEYLFAVADKKLTEAKRESGAAYKLASK